MIVLEQFEVGAKTNELRVGPEMIDAIQIIGPARGTRGSSTEHLLQLF